MYVCMHIRQDSCVIMYTYIQRGSTPLMKATTVRATKVMDLLLDAICVEGRPDLINNRYPAFACCQEPARALARTPSASKGLVYMGGRDRRKRLRSGCCFVCALLLGAAPCTATTSGRRAAPRASVRGPSSSPGGSSQLVALSST